MNSIPVLYICLTIFCAGFIVSIVIHSTYNHAKTHRTDTLPSLLLNYAAAVYIISDALAAVFAFLVPSDPTFRFFTILRELSPLILVILTPYYLNSALKVTDSIQKLNRILFLGGIVVAASIGVLVTWKPDLLMRLNTVIDGRFDAGASFSSRTEGPLLIVRDGILTACFIYSVSILLFREVRQKASSPFVKSLAGILVFGYFLFSYLYSTIFSGSPAGFGAVPYPHFGLGITFLIAFLTIRKIDIVNDYYSQLADIKKNMGDIVSRDSLLGIPNRLAFMRDLQAGIEATGSGGAPFSLLLLDIDDFQNLNESYGESIGDHILTQFALRLIELFGAAGSLYRIGGDDFAFLLRDIRSEQDAMDIADRIITSLRNPFTIAGTAYLVTASIGVLLLPRDGGDEETIVKNAYSVVRKAKKTKNSLSVFSPELVDASAGIIRTVNLLRDSINRDLFTLHYQPIVDSEERIVYAEALLRCTGENQSLGGPGHFIPIIEKAGLAKEVDNMVIHKAFHDMEVLVGQRFKISINLSTNQLVNVRYSDFLSSFADQHGIENRNIILEVTENQLMSNLASGKESLKKLRERGFSIAVDDFGTGFSSLAYLAELPVDILKVDMIFVQSVPGDSRKEAMAHHIVQLAHSLGLKVVAEGFETRAQFDFFRALGCDFFQGYLFSRPVPLNDLLKKYRDA